MKLSLKEAVEYANTHGKPISYIGLKKACQVGQLPACKEPVQFIFNTTTIMREIWMVEELELANYLATVPADGLGKRGGHRRGSGRKKKEKGENNGRNKKPQNS